MTYRDRVRGIIQCKRGYLGFVLLEDCSRKLELRITKHETFSILEAELDLGGGLDSGEIEWGCLFAGELGRVRGREYNGMLTGIVLVKLARVTFNEAPVRLTRYEVRREEVWGGEYCPVVERSEPG